MDPASIITLATLALQQLRILHQQWQSARSQGQITPEQQQEWVNKIGEIRTGQAFAGEEWQPTA